VFGPGLKADRQKLTPEKRRCSYQITIINDARKISLSRGMWTRFSVARHRLCSCSPAGLKLNSDRMSFFVPSGRRSSRKNVIRPLERPTERLLDGRKFARRKDLRCREEIWRARTWHYVAISIPSKWYDANAEAVVAITPCFNARFLLPTLSSDSSEAYIYSGISCSKGFASEILLLFTTSRQILINRQTNTRLCGGSACFLYSPSQLHFFPQTPFISCGS
jgi:hypothetical protein